MLNAMSNEVSLQERQNLEQWLKESEERRGLITQQVELIKGMMLSLDKFKADLQENAAAMRKAAPK